MVRAVFDRVTGYNTETMTEAQWLRRMIFLETVAGG
jgi:threonyl-tRNA synthetase